jgi:hypothetical protein
MKQYPLWNETKQDCLFGWLKRILGDLSVSGVILGNSGIDNS